MSCPPESQQPLEQMAVGPCSTTQRGIVRWITVLREQWQAGQWGAGLASAAVVVLLSAVVVTLLSAAVVVALSAAVAVAAVLADSWVRWWAWA